MERDITTILEQIRAGDHSAKAELFDRVYSELREMAKGQMKKERKPHTLQTTALVHEAYIRLMPGDQSPNFEDRSHFFGSAARVMRQLLTDHARTRDRKKRGGGAARVLLDQVLDELEESHDLDILDLNSALADLATMDDRQAQIVELRFFAGLSIGEVAEQLNVSRSTVEKDFASARAWLNLRLE
jgi:RNA polymerase sigma factor (TIGR02999 family)